MSVPASRARHGGFRRVPFVNDAATRDALRRQLKKARAAVEAATRERAAHAVADHLAPLLDELAPRTVAGYAALGGELPIFSALADCRARGRVTLLPALVGDRLAFSPYDEDTPMRPDRFGIDEPVVDEEDRLPPAALDVVLVPLVGFDEDLARLGMGGGFYDRSFAMRRDAPAPPHLVGVAFELQRVPSVSPDWCDVPLDAVVTESGVRRR